MLRRNLTKLAHENPETRAKLVPMLRQAREKPDWTQPPDRNLTPGEAWAKGYPQGWIDLFITIPWTEEVGRLIAKKLKRGSSGWEMGSMANAIRRKMDWETGESSEWPGWLSITGIVTDQWGNEYDLDFDEFYVSQEGSMEAAEWILSTPGRPYKELANPNMETFLQGTGFMPPHKAARHILKHFAGRIAMRRGEKFKDIYEKVSGREWKGDPSKPVLLQF